jgi:hypothetical protein
MAHSALKPQYIIGVIAMAASVTTYYLRPDLWVWQHTIGPALISYCELGNKSGRYHNKLVRVKARVAGDKDTLILYNAECDFWIDANQTELSFDPAFNPDSKINA